mmetsp:Transcript_7169/g.8668  ORF Transcript_7169/g.8668 Transcript_7169/m.8668 type:complete len:389 (-) Transcript_7169:640-1806(-)
MNRTYATMVAGLILCSVLIFHCFTIKLNPAKSRMDSSLQFFLVRDDREVLIFLNSKWWYSTKTMESTIPRNGSVVNCPVKCRVRHDEDAFHVADASIWNRHWMTPIKTLPMSKPIAQKWILSDYFEAPRMMHILRENLTSMDWSMSYMPGSDILAPMFRFAKAYPPMKAKKAKDREKLLLYISSACHHNRKLLFQSLDASLNMPERVSHFGHCSPNTFPCGGRSKLLHENQNCMFELLQNYKFYAAFENQKCRGYITEKFARAYQYGLVPIVKGGTREDYEILVPGNSFIHVDDFESTKALSEYILYLDNNDTAYEKILNAVLATKVTSSDHEVGESVLCEVCTKIKSNFVAKKGQVKDFVENVWNPKYSCDKYSANFDLTVSKTSRI